MLLALSEKISKGKNFGFKKIRQINACFFPGKESKEQHVVIV